MSKTRLPFLALAAWLLPGVANAQTTLVNGLPVPVSGTLNSITAFALVVPAGITSLVFATTGGTGDSDIVVNFGQPYLTTPDPTFDCASSSVTTEEFCEITNPAPGVWYVEVYGFAAYTDITLLGIAATEVTDGAPVAVAGAAGSLTWFYIEVPDEQRGLTATTSGGTGDPDLYVVEEPNLFLVQETCSSVEVGPADSCEVEDPAAGRWYVLVQGFTSFSGVSLVVNVTGGGGGGGGAPAPGTLLTLLLAALGGVARRRLRGR